MTRPTIDKAPLPGAEPFSIDAWLDAAALPEKTAVVYGRGDLAAEYDSLDDELKLAKQAAVDGPAAGMMNGPSQAEARRIADRMTEVRTELLKSKLTFRFRALPMDVMDEIRAGAEQIPEDKRAIWRAEQYIAASAVSPALTLEQTARLRAKIGEGQFAILWDAAWDVSNGKGVDIPFSLAHSATLATPTT